MATAAKRKVPYNPRVMEWARERLRLPVEMAAQRIKVLPEKVVAWERGDLGESPTVRQARALAALYDRPFLEFFSPTIPHIREPEIAPDFRFHRVRPSDQETVSLVEVQRWAEEIRLNAIDLFDLIGEPIPSFPTNLYCKIDEDVEKAALHVRKHIGFPVEIQTDLRHSDKDTFATTFRRKLEALGVLVLKQSGLQKIRTRGVCIYSAQLPIIIFGKESAGGTAFTLAHEFAHILLKQSAISASPRFGNGSHYKQIEGWCNRFAAAFLMPAVSLSRYMGDFPKKSEEISEDALRSLAKHYAVSPHAALIRLVNLGYVQPGFYWRIKRPQFVLQEEEYKGFGRPKYYGSRYRSTIGDLYTGLVMEAWGTGRITNHNAAEFMGIKKLDHLNDIRRNFPHSDG